MELFIKRFIDLLDEVAPVSLVHSIIEQPLGAVTHDYSIQIHSRLDLVQEDSPYCELEIYPFDVDKIEILYAFTYPAAGITIEEDQLIQHFINTNNNVKAEKIIPVGNEGSYYYELFYSEMITIPENNHQIDQKIHELTGHIKDMLSLGGYEKNDEE